MTFSSKTPLPSSLGQLARRGPLQEGERVQVADPKGRLYTITLVRGGRFESNRGVLYHDQVLGQPDGQVVETETGRTFQVIRPLLHDYAMSMPRGAAIIYPKDAGLIVQYGDIFPGARVLEAGVGSGGLSLSLLNAIGSDGHLVSVERRLEFADIAAANVDLWFGGRHPAWDVRVGELSEVGQTFPHHWFDRIILDLLDPWEYLDLSANKLLPGGVLVCYVATVSQLSRLADQIRETQLFTEPHSFETMLRSWHTQGLAVRPDHKMVAHTGFLLTTRRLAQGVRSHSLARRPAKAAAGKPGKWAHTSEWSEISLGLRTQTERKTRKVRREILGRARAWLAPPEK